MAQAGLRRCTADGYTWSDRIAAILAATGGAP
jgi:hypothetical protein